MQYMYKIKKRLPGYVEHMLKRKLTRDKIKSFKFCRQNLDNSSLEAKITNCVISRIKKN